MLCDVCKCNDATVFLTQILEGKMQKVNLCDACSKEKGVQDPTGFALADLLLGIGAAEEIEKGASTQKCPVCGFSQADFKKTGRKRSRRKSTKRPLRCVTKLSNSKAISRIRHEIFQCAGYCRRMAAR